MKVLITGAGGYIGRQLAARLSADYAVLGVDLKADTVGACQIHAVDIRDPALQALMKQEGVTHVVHLAAVLQDSGDRARDFDIDVNGTRNVLEACVGAGVAHITVTSSGAAYGYHPDNPAWLSEDHPLRGNPEFAYSDHKRQVEELLADSRAKHPALAQLVLRVGTVLGANTRNLITNLFEKKRLIGVAGSDSPFVFIWDQDLLAIIEQGVRDSRVGIFNVAGSGAMSMKEIAQVLGKPLISLPAPLIKAALGIARALRIGRYGPAQVNFLRYRPVLDNRRLREEFAYQPQKNSRDVFAYYVEHARARGDL